MFRRVRPSVLLASLAGLILVVSTASADAGPRHERHRDRGANLTASAVELADGLEISIETERRRRGKKKDRAEAAVLELEVVTANGKTKTRRIEVKNFESARLVVRHGDDVIDLDPVAEVPVEPAPVYRHIGRVENDTFDTCRYVFMLDNAEIAAVEFDSDGDEDLELPAGEYRVRVYGEDFFEQGIWKHVETVPLTVDSDGWRYERRDCDVR